MRISIVGQGVVGSAMRKLLEKHYDVGFDRSEADLGVVCVPTPPDGRGGCDTSTVEFAVRGLETEVVLIKSTVAPGTTDRLRGETGKRIVFSPEYMGESAYHNPYFPDDMAEVPWVTLGGEPEDTAWVQEVLLPVLGPTKRYFRTSALSAELAKYFENVFFGAKVALVNEFYEICLAFGADWHEAREAWLQDPRINRMHTAVFPEKRGFGGRCIPKDLSALIRASRDAGYEPRLLEEVEASNERFRSGE